MNKFIEKFKSELMESDDIQISRETDFRNLGSWDSLTGMAVLVMIKDEYGIDMPVDALKACKTVGDIEDYIVKHKK